MPLATIDSFRVLIVDDNRELAENLRELLTEVGYSVRLAGSCAEALESAQRGLDVALVDVRLPDGSGVSLAQQLKESFPECEVVLLTGFATMESATEAVRAGACAYLIKPCATPDLLLALQQATRQVRLQAEKRELGRRAQVAEKLAAVGTLTAGLSHEIRNPLNAAALQLLVLERRLRRLPAQEQPQLLEPLGLVQEEIQRLEHILQDFLQFARPREFVASTLDLAPLIDRVLDLLTGDAERRGVRLERAYQAISSVAGDPDLLRQVMMNLTLNAMEAVGQGGRVRVGIAPAVDAVLLTVDDDGPGISAELRERLFEPFFTTKAQGSGLGLPIVHALVTQHGGSIDVGSSDLGGARFTVRLPHPVTRNQVPALPSSPPHSS
jgi:two-component system, NtrC family, sensor histidine kinase HydH